MKQNLSGPTAPNAIHTYLLGLLGTDKAWRTTQEIARDLGLNTPESRDSISKGLWNLRRREGGPMVMTRKRAGANVEESMALIVDASARKKAHRRDHGRVEIATPAPGPVALRVEAVPAPALPEPSPEAREAVERLVRSPTPALTLADVLAKHKRDPTRTVAQHAQADAVVATAAEALTGLKPPPLPETQTGLGAGASEGAAVASYIEEVSNPAPIDVKAELAAIAEHCAADDDGDSDPTVELEIARLMELANRGSRRVAVERVQDKVDVLVMLAEALRIQFSSSRAAALLDEIVADLERVAAQA